MSPLLSSTIPSPPLLLLAAQGTLCGCSHWLFRKCRLSLLITPTWVTSTIIPSPQPYGQHWYRGGNNFHPPPPQPSFYHSYISLFIYPLTQFILSLTLYLSILSLAISPPTHLISYYVSSPILYHPLSSSPLLSSTKYQCRPPWPPPSRKRRSRVRVWQWQYFQFPWKYFPLQSHPNPLSLSGIFLDRRL